MKKHWGESIDIGRKGYAEGGEVLVCVRSLLVRFGDFRYLLSNPPPLAVKKSIWIFKCRFGLIRGKWLNGISMKRRRLSRPRRKDIRWVIGPCCRGYISFIPFLPSVTVLLNPTRNHNLLNHLRLPKTTTCLLHPLSFSIVSCWTRSPDLGQLCTCEIRAPGGGSLGEFSICGYEWRRIVGVGRLLDSGAAAMRVAGGHIDFKVSVSSDSGWDLSVGKCGNKGADGFTRRRKRRNRAKETAITKAKK